VAGELRPAGASLVRAADRSLFADSSALAARSRAAGCSASLALCSSAAAASVKSEAD
jgi:hypothetical protein